MRLKNRNFPLAILTVLFPIFSYAQYDSTKALQPINTYGNSVKNIRVIGANNIPTDTFKLATRDSGAIAFKGGDIYTYNGYVWQQLAKSSKLASKQPLITTGTITQYLRADLTVGSYMDSEPAPFSSSLNFTLNNTPLINSVRLYKNGTRLPNTKFSVNGAVLTLSDPRLETDILLTDYKF